MTPEQVWVEPQWEELTGGGASHSNEICPYKWSFTPRHGAETPFFFRRMFFSAFSALFFLVSASLIETQDQPSKEATDAYAAAQNAASEPFLWLY